MYSMVKVANRVDFNSSNLKEECMRQILVKLIMIILQHILIYNNVLHLKLIQCFMPIISQN